MLNPPGIGVPDCPPGLFPYPHPRWAEFARTFEPYIALGLGDREAWEALFDDPFRCKTTWLIYGKRCKGPRELPPSRRFSVGKATA